MRAPMVRRLSRSLKGLGRSIGRRSRLSIARQSVKDKKIRRKILEYIGTDIQKELTAMCNIKDSSMFRVQSKEDLEQFSWEGVVRELESRAPTLYSLLNYSIIVKSRRRPRTGGKTHRPRDASVLGAIAGLLLRHRSQRMNILQRLVSLILHCGHAGKQVNTHSCMYNYIMYTSSNSHAEMLYRILYVCSYYIGVPTSTEIAVVLVSSANKCVPQEAW